MATDGDEFDPSMGEVAENPIVIDDDDGPVIEIEREDWTKPTPESVHFKSPLDYHRI